MPTLEEIHVRCVRTEQGCLLWRGYVNPETGYSWMGAGSQHESELGHRLVFALAVRPLEDGEHVDHACHNKDLICAGGRSCLHRRCLEPAHLEAIDQEENNRRAAEHARRTPGSRWTNEQRGTCRKGLHPWISGNIGRNERQYFCIPCNQDRQQRYRDRKRTSLAG
jgi:hypothetical protein